MDTDQDVATSIKKFFSIIILSKQQKKKKIEPVVDFCVVGASFSGCYITAELSKLYPTKTIKLLERSQQLIHAGDEIVRITPSLRPLLENYSVPCSPSTSSVIITMRTTPSSAIHHPDPSTRPVVQEPEKKETVTRLFTSDVLVDNNFDPFVVHESWNVVRTLCQTMKDCTECFYDIVIKHCQGDREKADQIIATSGLPYYLCRGYPCAAVVSKLASMDPFLQTPTSTENNFRTAFMQGWMDRLELGADVKSFAYKDNLHVLSYIQHFQQKTLACRTLILAVPKEPLCRIEGWDTRNHPVRTMLKRVVTCRIDSEFRYYRLSSWLRETKLLAPTLWTTTPSTQKVLTDRLDRDIAERLRNVDTPSATPCRRANNTPAPPPSWWPLVTTSFPQHDMRVKATANPHDRECGMISFHIDNPLQANAWFLLQKEQGATAVRVAIYNLMIDLFHLFPVPFSFWSRVVPIYTTVWRQQIGLSPDFLTNLHSQQIYITGRDYSVKSQGHTEGALETAVETIRLIAQKE